MERGKKERERENDGSKERQRANNTGFFDCMIPARYFHYPRSSPKNIVGFAKTNHLYWLYFFIILLIFYFLDLYIHIIKFIINLMYYNISINDEKVSNYLCSKYNWEICHEQVFAELHICSRNKIAMKFVQLLRWPGLCLLMRHVSPIVERFKAACRHFASL